MRYRRPRYNRRRPSARGRNERIGFNAVLLILIAAVIAGYLTTRFVLYPLLGFEFPSLETIWDKYRPSVSEDKNSNKDKTEDSRSETKEQKTIVEDKKDASEEGYVIQFGSFSTKPASISFATILASVVLPVPDGPKNTAESKVLFLIEL